MNAKALENQNIVDIALEYTGSIETVFDIMVANPEVFPELLTPVVSASEIAIPAVVNNNLVRHFSSRKIHVVTGQDVEDNSGIDFWAIEQNFEVQ